MFDCADSKEHLCCISLIVPHTPTCIPSPSFPYGPSSFPIQQVKISDPVVYLLAQIAVSNLPHQRPSPSLLLSTMAGAEMTRSATEQPDTGMDSRFAVPAETAGPTGSTGPVNAANLGTLPLVTQMQWEIHVEFNNDMWWAMPHELSDSILQQWTSGARQVSFIWDWQATRKGSYQPNGADTSISRYIIDFDTMHQRNTDNDRTRQVKVVCVLRSPARDAPMQCYRAC